MGKSIKIGFMIFMGWITVSGVCDDVIILNGLLKINVTFRQACVTSPE